MTWQLTEEQQMIQLMVREFARREIEPYAADFDRKGTFPKEIIGKMSELGLMGMMIPVRDGGSDAGAVSYSLALQEIAYACASTAVTMSVSNLSCEPLRLFGTEEQKKDFLVPLANGHGLGAFALTEPDAGSDPGSIRTLAKRSGRDYRISGTKVFITNGAFADTTILVARTEEGGGNRSLSAFILPKDAPGLQVGPEEE